MGRPRRTSQGRIPAPEETSAQKAARQRGHVSRRHGELGEVAFLHKATELGFMVAQPYGTSYRFDFIVQGGQNLWRMQIKSRLPDKRTLVFRDHLSEQRPEGIADYSESEIDFVAVYIIPEDTWYILPVREVVGRSVFAVSSQGISPPRHLRPLPRSLAPPARTRRPNVRLKLV